MGGQRMGDRPDRKQESLLDKAVRSPGTVGLANSLEEEMGGLDPDPGLPAGVVLLGLCPQLYNEVTRLRAVASSSESGQWGFGLQEQE